MVSRQAAAPAKVAGGEGVGGEVVGGESEAATRGKVRAFTGAGAAKKSFAAWSRLFLAELATTSNVSAAARKAGVSSFEVYEARRANGEFARRWQVALCEGYDLLEMQLLQRMRDGELKPVAGAKRASRAYDNALALRLLAAHRESAARERAMRDNEDAEAILASIDAKLDRMRERGLAAKEAAFAAGAPVDGGAAGGD